MIYIYENHLSGDLYVTEDYIDDKYLYCEQCGDSDWLLLSTDDDYEVAEFLRSKLDIFGLGGYNAEYLQKIYDYATILRG